MPWIGWRTGGKKMGNDGVIEAAHIKFVLTLPKPSKTMEGARP